jgi:hypothetical protein
MLLFNKDYLETLCVKYSVLPQDILRHYKYILDFGILPKFDKKFKYKTKQLFGYSFILKPDRLLYQKTVDPIFISHYIKLASLRDFGLFSKYKISTLDLDMYPDINLENIKTNPLLQVVNNKLHFLNEK